MKQFAHVYHLLSISISIYSMLGMCHIADQPDGAGAGAVS